MIGKKSVVAACVAIAGAAYVASPYVTIWRLMEAVRHGDEQVLRASIDWESVRAGLKEDVAEGLIGGLTPTADAAPTQLAANVLPQFGASFISGIAGTEIDRQVTPDHLASMLRQLGPGESASGEGGNSVASESFGRVRHAFFDGPTRFDLVVLCPGQEAEDPPLHIRMELRDGGWKVVRAWIPQDLIDLANART